MNVIDDPMKEMPASPPLNVVLPSNVKTGFLKTTTTGDAKKRVGGQKKPRAQTATHRKRPLNAAGGRGFNHRGRRIKAGMDDQDEVYSSSLVVMNDKWMNVGPGASAKGIVSLYNKGFVPKKTGKVNQKSKFCRSGKMLYETVKEKEHEQLNSIDADDSQVQD